MPCPVCNVMHKSNRQLNNHMKEKYPKFKFQCAKCKKEFSSYNACYKHIVRRHYALRHKCDICGKGFAFSKERDDHMKTDTKKGLFPCTYLSVRNSSHQTGVCFSICSPIQSKLGHVTSVQRRQKFFKLIVTFDNT